MAEFTVHPCRTALVIVDMQHCFVADPPIAAPHGIAVAEAFSFAEVDTGDQVLSRIPAAITAAAEA